MLCNPFCPWKLIIGHYGMQYCIKRKQKHYGSVVGLAAACSDPGNVTLLRPEKPRCVEPIARFFYVMYLCSMNKRCSYKESPIRSTMQRKSRF